MPCQRTVLWAGELIEPVQHGRAQLMQPGIGQLHLRLCASGAQHPPSIGALSEVVQQRRLADARLAAEHEDLTLPGLTGRQQAIQELAFAAAAVQSSRSTRTRHLANTHPSASSSLRPRPKPWQGT